MKTRTGSLLGGISAVMSAMMFFQACGGPDGSGLVMTASQVQTLDGKELFRGLILGRGDVAKHFPETWGDVDARKSAIMAMDPGEMISRLDTTASYMREKHFPEAMIAQVEDASRRMKAGTLTLSDGRDSEALVEGALIAAIEGSDSTFFPRFQAAVTSGDRLAIAKMFQEAITKGADAAPALGYQLSGGDTQLPIALAIVAVVFIAIVLVCCDPCLPDESAMSPLNREDYINLIAERVALPAGVR